MTKPRLLKKSLLSMPLLFLGTAACQTTTCLVAGTMISTPEGPLAIERIQPGQKVFAFDEERRCITVRTVTHVFRHEDRYYGRLLLADGRRLLVTDSHPIYVANRAEYVTAGELAAGEEVLVWEGSDAAAPRLSKVAVRQAFLTGAERATVFDITVDGEHNYFADGILVHNKSLLYLPSILEVRSSGNGTGAIEVQINGSTSKQCVGACTFDRSNLGYGTIYVTLTAVPGAGSRFDGWEPSGQASCTNQATCSFYLSGESTSVTAKFAICSAGTWCPVAIGKSDVLKDARDIWAASDHDAWVVAAPESEPKDFLASPVLWRWDGRVLTPDHQRAATDQPLLAISGSSPTAAWAVGNRGTVLHWDGVTWSVETIATLATLRSVRADAQTVWAVGDAGTILQRSGGVWNFFPSPTRAHLFSVFSLGSSAAWAVGGQGTIVHWDGVAWTADTSDTAADLHGVWGSSASDLWAVGAAGTMLHWDGSAWKSVASGLTEGLLGIRETGPGRAVAFGTNGTLLRWDGVSWQPDTSLPEDFGAVYSIWPSAGGDNLAATERGVLRLLP